jgi:hypothetical protein
MNKNLQIFGWAAISFFIGMGAQFTGAPNFLVGLAFYALGGIGVLFGTFSFLRRSLPVTTSSILAGLAGLAYACLVWYAIVTSEKPPAVDVTALFVSRLQPSIILSNNSSRTASSIIWSPVLFNLTDAYNIVASGRDDVVQPLQIPAQRLDFLKAGQKSLQIDIFQGRIHGLKYGDKIFGSVTINCQDCGRGHTFIYFVAIGQSGWVWEDTKLDSGYALVPVTGMATSIIKFYNQLNSLIPQDKRLSIYENS